MGRRKRIELDDGEIRLPESIIQEIQSRLSRKEAFQTTVLSKSWYRASLTRADVVLDDRGFRKTPDRFSVLARESMRRYDELNLNIDSFRLCMENVEGGGCLLAVELVQKAMGFGANDIEVGFMSTEGKSEFVLPVEVLGSEKLVRLSVKGFQCEIDIGEDGKVNCPNLRSLELGNVFAQGDVIWDIISSCPLIENLRLSECKFLYEEPRGNRIAIMERYMDLGCFGFGKQNFINDTNEYTFRNLTNLMLRFVKVHPFFFRGFSLKFPCLKHLTLSNCLSPTKIYICSNSLECIQVDQIIRLRARISVPNLRVFTCSSGHIPSLTFGTCSRQWESRIYTSCSSPFSLAWFRQFKSFLSVMSVSKLSLRLSFLSSCRDSFVYDGYLKPRLVLEDLTVDSSALGNSVFWDGLIWSCCPQTITISWSPSHKASFEEFVSKRLTKLSENCYIPNKNVFGQWNLEEVNAEVFYESVAEWEPVTWKTLLDAWTVTKTERKFRFHFRWDSS